MDELTWFGWVIITPRFGVESSMYSTQTSHSDLDCLCQLNIIGLEDRQDGHQEIFDEEFKEQLKRDSIGCCKTGFPWKAGHPLLQHNKDMSLALSRAFKKTLKTI